MSRLGKRPVFLPEGVTLTSENRQIVVKGKKGTIPFSLPLGVDVSIEQDGVYIKCSEIELKQHPAIHGLYRSILNNAIIGVSQGFRKQLALVGVGYRAALRANTLDLQLGYSHPIQIPVPQGIEVVIEKNGDIIISGIDKQAVGQFAAYVRAKRPPEPYKGKGIRYVNEYVRKKAGKAVKGSK